MLGWGFPGWGFGHHHGFGWGHFGGFGWPGFGGWRFGWRRHWW